LSLLILSTNEGTKIGTSSFAIKRSHGARSIETVRYQGQLGPFHSAVEFSSVQRRWNSRHRKRSCGRCVSLFPSNRGKWRADRSRNGRHTHRVLAGLRQQLDRTMSWLHPRQFFRCTDYWRLKPFSDADPFNLGAQGSIGHMPAIPSQKVRDAMDRCYGDVQRIISRFRRQRTGSDQLFRQFHSFFLDFQTVIFARTSKRS
jgi:hypothetical protein